MAAHTSLLLVIALCAATAHALKCYSCTGQSTNANCLKETDCTNGLTECQTTVGTVGGQSVSITKTCTLGCVPIGDSNSPLHTTCCDTDLCNYSGGATIRSSCAAILLALGSVLIILKSSVL